MSVSKISETKFREAFHKRWLELSIYQQMANIGSEIGRAMKWKGVNSERAESAAIRALELIGWTLSHKRNRQYLKEITRIREVFLDTFYGDNLYSQDQKSWDTYFYPYALAANKK